MSQRLAKAVPAFGGAFIKDAVLHVHLKDLGEGARMRAAVSSELRRLGREGLAIQIRPADYAFAELEEFHLLATRLSYGPGVRFMEVDERENRVRIGVADEQTRSNMEKALEVGGIPRKAVVYQITAAPTLLTSLDDRIRPLIGGTRIFPAFAGQHVDNFCTYGVNVEYSGGRHMIVNSHCTQVDRAIGGWVGAEIHQSHWGPWYDRNANRIGVEIQDPSLRSDLWGCPSGHVCRYSDAALVEIYTNESWDHGGIARPVSRTLLPQIEGSKTISSSNPRFQIAEPLSELLVGDVVEKVGARTGWTAGTVISTCRTVSPPPDASGIVFSLLCSGAVQAGVGAGDSGSPVFWQSSANGGHYFVGILFAGLINPATGLGQEYYFSKWQLVDSELGSPTNDLMLLPSPNQDPGCGAQILC